MRCLASVSYDGSKFFGFQRLNNHLTVQGELERVLERIVKEKVEVKGAGRTDRGVHAYSQGVSFDLKHDIPLDGLKRAMNSLLCDYVYVNRIEEVDDDFHARFRAKKKVYEYRINLGEYNPVLNDYIYNYGKSLNIKKMKEASRLLVGAHSFKAFTSGDRDNYNSIIYSISFKKDKDVLVIRFEGKSFYRYMVRNLVGTLINVGSGKFTISDVKKMLEGENRQYQTVPACGLYLIKVFY